MSQDRKRDGETNSMDRWTDGQVDRDSAMFRMGAFQVTEIVCY